MAEPRSDHEQPPGAVPERRLLSRRSRPGVIDLDAACVLAHRHRRVGQASQLLLHLLGRHAQADTDAEAVAAGQFVLVRRDIAAAARDEAGEPEDPPVPAAGTAMDMARDGRQGDPHMSTTPKTVDLQGVAPLTVTMVVPADAARAMSGATRREALAAPAEPTAVEVPRAAPAYRQAADASAASVRLATAPAAQPARTFAEIPTVMLAKPMALTGLSPRPVVVESGGRPVDLRADPAVVAPAAAADRVVRVPGRPRQAAAVAANDKTMVLHQALQAVPQLLAAIRSTVASEAAGHPSGAPAQKLTVPEPAKRAPAALGSETLEQITEKVSSRIYRRLLIESERRGQAPWRR